MSTAQVLSAAPPRDHHAAAFPDRLELFGVLSLFAVAGAVQFSIAIAQILLTIAIFCWLAVLVAGRERFGVPRFFWPLAAYAGATLVSAAFSSNPRLSFVDSKQLVLFLIVPVAFRFVSGRRGPLLLTLMMSLGAASAAFGMFQWGLLHYDRLGLRPQGTLGHYMTYSGLLMLIIGIAVSKLLFGKGERLWAALVMPALVMAVAITLSRNAWVGTCAAAAVLLALKDFRMLAALPVAVALTFAVAGATVNERLYSMFNTKDATRLDRMAMLREGERMVRAHPLVGVGPNMVQTLYEQFRDASAVEKVNPHLHNVPAQIAAERGLPALAIWLTFIGLLSVDLLRSFRRGQSKVLSAAAIAAVVAMLAGGLFEYNFGDSEFLILFLLIVTIPFAAARPTTADAA
jgi:putative inorganic carbon (hco3(-)) transporter